MSNEAATVQTAPTQPRAYKHSLDTRKSKAAASARHRARRQAEKDGVAVAPEHAKREGYQQGNRSIDTAGMSPEELDKLNRHREGKRQATIRHKERAKLVKEGVSPDQWPEHLQPKVRESKADQAVKPATARPPKAAKAAKPAREPKPDTSAPITLDEMKVERKFRRGGQDVFARLVGQGNRGFSLQRYTKDGDAKTIVGRQYVKTEDLPTTQKGFSTLFDSIKPATVEA
jgi:hypothetical protein